MLQGADDDSTMNPGFDTPFESIESAHEFVKVLTESIHEAQRELQSDVQREAGSNFQRRLDALLVAEYSLKKLEFHMNRSLRILNDLRTLRRLLFEERNPGAFKKQVMAGGEPASPISSSPREERHARPNIHIADAA